MTRLYLLYTGGTFGMLSGGDGTLSPSSIEDVFAFLPDWNIDWHVPDGDDNVLDVGKLLLPTLDIEVSLGSCVRPIDSSSINHEHWRYFAEVIYSRYQDYDGFVIIHGTDTMAYTASALSFIFSGLEKPVVLTGAMIPVDQKGSDAAANLGRALLTASSSTISEVVIAFGSSVIRGCRATKSSSVAFDAFSSPVWPELAAFGPLKINKLNLNNKITASPESSVFHLEKIKSGVDVCWLHPGIDWASFSERLHQSKSKAIILACYGDGHLPENKAFIRALQDANDRGMVLISLSQCWYHPGTHGRYAVSRVNHEAGVVDGGDATLEATITKLMWALANCCSRESIARVMLENIRGERTV